MTLKRSDTKNQASIKDAIHTQCHTVFDDLYKLTNNTHKSNHAIDEELDLNDAFDIEASGELSYDDLHLRDLAMKATDDPILQVYYSLFKGTYKKYILQPG